MRICVARALSAFFSSLSIFRRFLLSGTDCAMEGSATRFCYALHKSLQTFSCRDLIVCICFSQANAATETSRRCTGEGSDHDGWALSFFIYLFIKCIQPKDMTLNYFRICFYNTNKSTLYNPSMESPLLYINLSRK